jgi:hypothetical protein
MDDRIDYDTGWLMILINSGSENRRKLTMNHTHRHCKRFESSCDGAIVVAAPSTVIGVDGNIDFNVVGGNLSGEEGVEGVHCVMNGLFKLACV